MAEQFKKLLDVNLGESDFTNGSCDIYTTTQNTILKDVLVTPESGLSLNDTYLEINGINIGSIGTKNTTFLTGHEIIPTGSTIKLKTSAYPFVFEKVIGVSYGSTDNKMYYYSYIETADGSIFPTTDTDIQFVARTYRGSTNTSSQFEDCFYSNYTGGGRAIWYTTHDDNSVQTIQHTGGENVTTSSSSSWADSQLNYQNYKSFGLLDFRRNITATERVTKPFPSYSYPGGAAGVVSNDNGNFKSYVFGGAVNPSFSWSNSSYTNYAYNGAHSPYPTSSYPRGHAAQGLYYYITSNSNPSQLYIKSLETGAFYYFPMPLNITYSPGNFISSVDVANDKLYLYSQINSTTVRWFKVNVSWSELRTGNNFTANTRKDFTSSDFTYEDINLPFSISTNNYQNNLMGYTPTGGLRIRDQNGKMYKIENGEVVHSYDTPPISGVPTPSVNKAWRHFGVPLLNSEISSAGLTAPGLRVSLHGITV